MFSWMFVYMWISSDMHFHSHYINHVHSHHTNDLKNTKKGISKAKYSKGKKMNQAISVILSKKE